MVIVHSRAGAIGAQRTHRVICDRLLLEIYHLLAVVEAPPSIEQAKRQCVVFHGHAGYRLIQSLMLANHLLKEQFAARLVHALCLGRCGTCVALIVMMMQLKTFQGCDRCARLEVGFL